MSNKGLFRTGLIFAVLTTLGWALFVVGGLTQPPGGDIGAVEEYLAGANSTGTFLYHWGGVLGSLAAIPVFLAFFQGFRHDTGTVLAVPVAFAIVGSAYLAMGFMVDAGSAIYQFSSVVSAAEAQDAVQLATAAQIAQDTIETTWFIGSFLAYGFPIVWMAVLFSRSTRALRWLNWAGLLGGLIGFIWIVRFMPFLALGGVFFVFVLLNIVLVMVWLIGLSLILDRGNDQQSLSQAQQKLRASHLDTSRRA